MKNRIKKTKSKKSQVRTQSDIGGGGLPPPPPPGGRKRKKK